MIRFVLAAALLCALSISAEARQPAMHKDCNIIFPCVAPYASTPGQVRVARGRFVARSFGFGAAIEKPAVRRSKALAKVDYRQVIKAPRQTIKIEPERRVVSNYGAPTPSAGYSLGRPARYIGGRLICAVNVGVALAERGIKGTGSALALSYLHWGRSAGGPVPGAVIVSARRGGGHVAIVSRVENGVVFAWNATGGQSGWREIPYRHRIIDYRVPG